MDETLKRRLIGAALMVVAAFLLASMLPEPSLRPAHDRDTRVVSIPLQGDDEIAALPPVGTESPMPTALANPRPASDLAGGVAEDDAPPEFAGSEPVAELTKAPPVAPKPAASKPAAATPAPRERIEVAATATPAPTPAPTPVATAAPTAPAKPVPATPSPAARGGSGPPWWVQIGSYSNIENAHQVEARMRALGEPVIVAPIETSHGVLYRVRCGPYPDEARGQTAHARVVGDGYADARLINP